jgi:hypothetical protein
VPSEEGGVPSEEGGVPSGVHSKMQQRTLRNCPLFRFPLLWNSLHINVKLQNNPSIFKFTLINHLFEELSVENEIHFPNAEVHSL